MPRVTWYSTGKQRAEAAAKEREDAGKCFFAWLDTVRCSVYDITREQKRFREGESSMPVSIRDVAKAAGVSVGTVSRAFNDYSDIKEETKQTILAVAKQMGYLPNLHAKTLSAKNRQSMAIILSGFMADHGLTDELVIKMLRGACCYAEENNIEFATYILSSEQQEEKTYEQFCSEHSLAGAMCFGI